MGVVSPSLRQHVASHEVDETRRKGKGNEQRRSVEDDCHGARIQVQNLFSDVQQLRQHGRKGGEEDWCVCHSRPVPNQDTNKAGVRVMFGKEVKVKAKPAKTVVKVFPAAALK